MNLKEENYLKEHNITITPVRILVLRSLQETTVPVSLSDLETKLDTVDKSTISRTLSLFKEKNLIHSFTDGSGSMKYELCKSHNHEVDDDLHVHFRCEKCGNTICLTNVKIPEIILPANYTVTYINYVVNGICPNCSK